MHRMKIGLIAAGLLLALTVVFYFVITGPLKEEAATDVEEEVGRAQRLHTELVRLEALDFKNLVSTLSRRPGVASVFDRAGETARRTAAFEECQVINGKLAVHRKADIVAIVDAQGAGVARDLDPNAIFGEDLRKLFPPIDAALKGAADHGVVLLSNRMALMAVAPVAKADGKVLGALVVGYVINARDAQAKRDQLGADVGYFFRGQVQTSSFTEGNGAEGKEDGNRTHALAVPLFQQGDKQAQQALEKNAPTGAARVTLDDQDYLSVAAPFYPGDRVAGFVVLRSMSHAGVLAAEVGGKVIAFGILAILVALGVAIMTAVRFIKPLDQIELGVGEIINGNIDHTFKPVGPDFEGLSNSLNVMLARLLGREEPNEDAVEDEDGETAQQWEADHMVIEEHPHGAVTNQPSSDPEVQALAAENEASYYQRLLADYTAALKSAGKPTKGLSVQLFTAKLRLVEGGLRQKWECKQVRFRVAQRNGEVTLQPVPIF